MLISQDSQMPLARLLPLTLLLAILSGCASDGSSSSWSDIAILPNMTNVPTVHYTPDGFDTPYDYY
jgi:hypothetical protein